MEFIFYSIIFFIPFIAILIKRKRQFQKKWNPSQYGKIIINAIPFSCHHCKNDTFFKREALINTSLVTFFNFTAFNTSGVGYICKDCGLIHWFKKPQVVEELCNPSEVSEKQIEVSSNPTSST